MMIQNLYSAKEHHYEFSEGGINYRAPNGRELTLPWEEIQEVKKSAFTGKLILVGQRAKVPLFALDSATQKAFLLDLFARWKRRVPDAAKKAAFDYVDTQKGLSIIVLCIALGFATPIAFAMLKDSFEQYSCSQKLRQSASLSSATIVKLTRKNDGPYLMNLQIPSKVGPPLLVKDQELPSDKKIPLNNFLPIFVSSEDGKCWSLPKDLEKPEIDFARFRFFTAYTLLFGFCFLISALFGLLWSLARLWEKRVAMKEVTELFSFH